RLRDAAQYVAVRRHRPPGDEHPVRHEPGPADRHDAGGQVLERIDDLPRGARLRAPRRLARILGGLDNPFSSDWLRAAANGPRPHGGTSYVAGPAGEPLKFMTVPQLLDRAVLRY